MDIFSIAGISYYLTKETYIKVTNKKEPYFQGKSYFAICPCCGNPIQIINLFREEYEENITKRRRLHARHIPRSILGIAEYNEEKYHSCELHNPVAFDLKKIGNNSRKNEELKELIEKNKKKIIYAIKAITSFYFKNERLEKIINSFLENKNYCYTYINRFNIPYVILYTEKSINIYGQILNIDNELGQEIYSSIERKSDFFTINEEKKILKREDVSFFSKIFLMIHEHRVSNGKQTVSLKIFEEGNNKENIILERTITMTEFIYKLGEKND
nr:hypothetical protein [Fusobacterium gastrosuis]